MPLITHALLYAGYALLALTTGLALAQVGGSEPGEATIGALALFCAFSVTHAGLSAAYATGAVGRTEKKIKADMDKLRVAHREVVAEMDAMGDRIDRIDSAVTEIAHRPIEAPREPEVKLIDRIVDKLGRQMDERLGQIARITGPGNVRERGPIDMVREALDDNRVELHLQPIVALPQRKSVFYEGFTRLKDDVGRTIMPGDFMPAAEKAGLMPVIDNMLLFRCVQIVKKLAQRDRRVAIFCNITPRALSDDAFFPQFLDFLRDHRDMAGAVIFELPQDAFEARTSREARAMAKLADLGYRFSIDKVMRLDIDIVAHRWPHPSGHPPEVIDHARDRGQRRGRRLHPLRHRHHRRAHRGRSGGCRNPRTRNPLRPGPPVRRPARDQGKPDGGNGAPAGDVRAGAGGGLEQHPIFRNCIPNSEIR